MFLFLNKKKSDIRQNYRAAVYHNDLLETTLPQSISLCDNYNRTTIIESVKSENHVCSSKKNDIMSFYHNEFFSFCTLSQTFS